MKKEDRMKMRINNIFLKSTWYQELYSTHTNTRYLCHYIRTRTLSNPHFNVHLTES